MVTRVLCPECSATRKIETDDVADMILCRSCKTEVSTPEALRAMRRKKKAGVIRLLIGVAIMLVLGGFSVIELFGAGLGSFLILSRRTDDWSFLGWIALVLAGLRIWVLVFVVLPTLL